MEDVNEIFESFAECFVGNLSNDEEIAHSAILKRDALDYSVESLKAVDAYLDYLHEHRPDELGPEWISSVLWGGAYVGEVIRRNAKHAYDWIDFDEFIHEHPSTTQILGDEKQLGFCALLTSGDTDFTLPINKILKYIFEGSADSVHFFVACELHSD
ncbi:MAG: hypothetical protein ACE37H_17735 [Phycisphaeraceae bacterium]